MVIALYVDDIPIVRKRPLITLTKLELSKELLLWIEVLYLIFLHLITCSRAFQCRIVTWVGWEPLVFWTTIFPKIYTWRQCLQTIKSIIISLIISWYNVKFWVCLHRDLRFQSCLIYVMYFLLYFLLSLYFYWIEYSIHISRNVRSTLWHRCPTMKNNIHAMKQFLFKKWFECFNIKLEELISTFVSQVAHFMHKHGLFP